MTKQRMVLGFACSLVVLGMASSGLLHAQTPADTVAPGPARVAAPPPAAGAVIRGVRFEIDMRAQIAAGRFDPRKDGVGLRGASPPLSWSQSLMAEPLGEGRYRVDVAFERPPGGGQPLQYKFRVERPGLGPNEGWEEGRNRTLLLRVPSQTVARAFDSPPEPVPAERTGRIDRIAPVPSKHVAPREVQVWLPPGYEQNGARRYPVLYMHDGQAMFDAEATGAEWQLDETAQHLITTGAIEPLIVVAVANSRDRMDEYTPTASLLSAERTGLPVARRMGGGAARYAEYLIRELKPMIDRRYRTRPDPENTATGGSSLAGLLSLWLALHHHDVFGAALVVSPSVWWDHKFVLRDAAAAPLPAPGRPRLWLDIGTEEGAEALPVMRDLRDTLLKRGWRDASLRYLEVPGSTHDEASWALRVEGMLRFLYAKPSGQH